MCHINWGGGPDSAHGPWVFVLQWELKCFCSVMWLVSVISVCDHVVTLTDLVLVFGGIMHFNTLYDYEARYILTSVIQCLYIKKKSLLYKIILKPWVTNAIFKMLPWQQTWQVGILVTFSPLPPAWHLSIISLVDMPGSCHHHHGNVSVLPVAITMAMGVSPSNHQHGPNVSLLTRITMAILGCRNTGPQYVCEYMCVCVW